MPYGMQVRTNRGMVDLATIKSFRILQRGNYAIPTSPDIERTQTITIPTANKSDLSGPVMLLIRHRRSPNNNNRLYRVVVAMPNGSNYYANAANIPSSITVKIFGSSAPGESNPRVFIDLYAIQL